MAQRWHKRHISTKWGIAILGFLLVSMLLTVGILNQSQDVRSRAATLIKVQPYNYVNYHKYLITVNHAIDIPLYLNPTSFYITKTSLKIFYSSSLRFVEFIPNKSLNMTARSSLKGNLSYKQYIELNISFPKGLTRSSRVGTLRMLTIPKTDNKTKPELVYLMPESTLQYYLSNPSRYATIRGTDKSKGDYVNIEILPQPTPTIVP